MMNKVSAIRTVAAVSALLCGSLSAADLGQARVRSYLGQPLVVDVPLVIEGQDESGQLTAIASGTLADPSGADRTLALTHEVRRYQSGQHFIRLTSSTPVDASRVTVWLMIEGPYGKASRSFPLKLHAKASGPGTKTSTTTTTAPPAPARPAQSSPRLTIGALAAANAQLDEETRRVSALVAQQQQALTAQAALVARQHEQLATLDRQSRHAADVTNAARAQLDERSHVLNALSAQLNGLLDAPADSEPASAPVEPHGDTTPGKAAVDTSQVTAPALPADTGAPPIAPGPASTLAPPVPAQGSPRPAAPPAGRTTIPGENGPAHGSTWLWVAVGALTAALTGSAFFHWRQRSPRTSCAAAASCTAWPPGWERLHTRPGAKGIPGMIQVPSTAATLLWVDASGLTDSLIEHIRHRD